jgi:hypothetical protein
MKYTISQNSGMGASPVWWVMEGEERIAGVHWGLHGGKSANAQKVAKKIADALNEVDEQK